MTFAIKIYGCQMNVSDGDRLRTAMTARGWEEVEDFESADVAVFITCSIRDKAEQKAVSDLGRFRRSWERGRCPRVVLMGCMAQRTGAEIARKFPWIKIVAGPRHIGSVPEAIERSASIDGTLMMLDSGADAPSDLLCAPTPAANAHKAYVTISHGCDQFCTYCIVPYVRGRFASRPMDEVLGEIRALAEAGTVEVTLLGQNVDTYGRDIGLTFASLLKRAAKIEGIRRLRFVTSHPLDFTDEIIELMATEPVICPSLNLPVQSGNDKVLREMNRKYTRRGYTEIVERLRASVPDAAITTDMIVGFPGETDSEFRDSLSLLEEVRFDLVHSAAYSPREGTPAAMRADQIPDVEKFSRLAELNALQERISLEKNTAMIGRREEVLVDEPSGDWANAYQARTGTDKVVLVDGTPDMVGTFRTVAITDAKAWSLYGVIV